MSKPPERRTALGKGLSALLPPRNEPARDQAPPPPPGPTVARISVDLIDPNPLQPRTIFDPGAIAGLAESIRANGVIQPLIVRRNKERFELVAGERRLRAAKLAELRDVPAVVQDYADDRLLEVALVENIQREDLNPIETAQALERLATDMSLSHEEIGNRTGKDRATVTNLLRLLKLPKEIQLLVAEHKLAMGHARALLGIPISPYQLELSQRIANEGLSVRQVEQIVADTYKDRPRRERRGAKSTDPNVSAAARELESVLGTRVRIVEQDDQKGRIEIEYYSQEDLNRIYDLVVGSAHRDN